MVTEMLERLLDAPYHSLLPRRSSCCSDLRLLISCGTDSRRFPPSRSRRRCSSDVIGCGGNVDSRLSVRSRCFRWTQLASVSDSAIMWLACASRIRSFCSHEMAPGIVCRRFSATHSDSTRSWRNTSDGKLRRSRWLTSSSMRPCLLREARMRGLRGGEPAFATSRSLLPFDWSLGGSPIISGLMRNRTSSPMLMLL